MLVEPQHYEALKNPWLTCSTPFPAPSDSAVTSKPNGKSQLEVTSPSYKTFLVTTPQYDNPINSCGSMSSSLGTQMSAESKFLLIEEALPEYLPEDSTMFEDPCYIPDLVSLMGPVSESLDNFQLDLAFVTYMELKKPRPIKSTLCTLISSEVITLLFC